MIRCSMPEICPGRMPGGEDVETAARAMYRMAERTFGEKAVENIFRF